MPYNILEAAKASMAFLAHAWQKSRQVVEILQHTGQRRHDNVYAMIQALARAVQTAS